MHRISALELQRNVLLCMEHRMRCVASRILRYSLVCGYGARSSGVGELVALSAFQVHDPGSYGPRVVVSTLSDASHGNQRIFHCLREQAETCKDAICTFFGFRHEART